jgi:hypothetical protein
MRFPLWQTFFLAASTVLPFGGQAAPCTSNASSNKDRDADSVQVWVDDVTRVSLFVRQNLDSHSSQFPNRCQPSQSLHLRRLFQTSRTSQSLYQSRIRSQNPSRLLNLYQHPCAEELVNAHRPLPKTPKRRRYGLKENNHRRVSMML